MNLDAVDVLDVVLITRYSCMMPCATIKCLRFSKNCGGDTNECRTHFDLISNKRDKQKDYSSRIEMEIILPGESSGTI